jgi:hypothetical protein
MSAPAPRIRIVIDSIHIRGIPQRDARRLVDGLERELAGLAPDLARAAQARSASAEAVGKVNAALPARRRVETAAGPIAQAILKALDR